MRLIAGLLLYFKKITERHTTLVSSTYRRVGPSYIKYTCHKERFLLLSRFLLTLKRVYFTYELVLSTRLTSPSESF
jgi:hypothetical protein